MGEVGEDWLRLVLSQIDRNPYRPEFVGRCLPDDGGAMIEGSFSAPLAGVMLAWRIGTAVFLLVGLLAVVVQAAIGTALSAWPLLTIALVFGALGFVLNRGFQQDAAEQRQEILERIGAAVEATSPPA